MVTLQDIIDIIPGIIKELRYRYGETYVDKIKDRKTKIEIYMIINKRRAKIIVDKYSEKVRVYTGLKGQEIAIRRVYERNRKTEEAEKICPIKTPIEKGSR